MDTKGKIVRSLSLKIANKVFPIYGSLREPSKELRKYNSTSKLEDIEVDSNKQKNEAKPSLKQLSVNDSGMEGTDKRGSLRRSLSKRFKGLQSFRMKKGSSRRSFNFAKRDHEKVIAGKDNGYHGGKVGLKKEFTKRHRKVMSRKFRSAPDITARGDNNLIRLAKAFQRKGKSCSDLGTGVKDQKSGKIHKLNLALNLRSRLNSGSEHVDFSSLVKPVKYSKWKPSGVNSSAEDSPIIPVRPSLQLSLTQLKAPALLSPTCADMYGQDEEEGYSSGFAEPIGLTGCAQSQKVIPGVHSDVMNDDCVIGIGKAKDGENLESSSRNSMKVVTQVNTEKTFTEKSALVLLEDKNNLDKKAKVANLKTAIQEGRSLVENKKIKRTCSAGDIQNEADKVKLNNVENITEKGTKVKNKEDTIRRRRSETLTMAYRDSVCDIKALPVADFDISESLENPWVLQTDTVPDANTAKSEQSNARKQKVNPKLLPMLTEDYTSFGFEVNESFQDQTDCGERFDNQPVLCGIVSNQQVVKQRHDSVESIDSFSSSVHSVHSQDLLFSDSDPEMGDNLSISSSDSGTFGTKVSPVVPSSNTSKYSSKRSKEKKAQNKRNKSQINTASTPKQIDIFDKVTSPFRTPRSFFSLKAFSLDDSDTKKSEKEKTKTDILKNRRSLDSNLKIKEMSLDLDEQMTSLKSKLTGSSDSGLSSALSPLMETGDQVPLKNSHSSGNLNQKNEVKFYTLPNPKKAKKSVGSPNKRRVTRIGSISKKLSEKAQSISNLKLGTSFKIRSSSDEKLRVPSFLKTKSLTNLMAKKGAEVASSISSMIRGRSYSSTSVDSPFRQKSVKKKKKNEKEFVYEKIQISVPRKKPATKAEILAWKKRLMHKAKVEDHTSDEQEFRSRIDTYTKQPNGQLRSPTLLDEIWKTMDSANLRTLCKNIEEGDDLSDGEESSASGSSPFLMDKQCSVDSGILDLNSSGGSVFISVCKSCGRLRNPSATSDFSDGDAGVSGIKTRRCALSMCDLNSNCACKQKNHLQLKMEQLQTESDMTKKKIQEHRQSYCSETESSSPESLEPLKKPTSASASTHSMYELRQTENFVPNFGYTKAVPCEGKLSKGGDNLGALLRHRPVFDLSADNLDNVCDDDVEDVTYCEDTEGRSLSCGDILTQQEKEKVERDESVTRKGDDLGSQGSELFHSCSELVQDIKVCDKEEQNKVTQKAHSCSDLLDNPDIPVFDRLMLKQNEVVGSKRKVRTVKVKSMSSSHDVLNTFVPWETSGIDGIADKTCKDQFKEKIDRYENSEVKSNVMEVKETKNENISGIDVSKDLVDCDMNDNNCDSKAIITHENQENETEIKCCAECNKSRHLSASIDKKEIQFFPTPILARKPPLPKNRRRSKVLSVNDIDLQYTRQTSQKHMKRYSLNELENTTNDFVPFSRLDSPRSSQSGSQVDDAFCTDTKKDFYKSSDIAVSSAHSRSKSETTPSSDSVRRFLFDERHINTYKKSIGVSRSPNLDRIRSASSEDMPTSDSAGYLSRGLSYSDNKLCSVPKHSLSDDVFNFNRLSIPMDIPEKFPQGNDFVGSPSYTGFQDSFLEFPDPDLQTVVKYDVCLGYLLHSVQCDNQVICVYSLQRNKQLMDSVITPLAALPGAISPPARHTEHVNVNRHKPQPKTKSEDLPNPAAPITSVPSEKLAHAGCVIRTMLLTRASHMIRDRKFHLRTYRRCMVGTEMVDWLLQQSPLVHSRTQAVGMWQALVEEGVIVHVCHEHQFKDKYLFYRFHEDDEGVSTVPTSATKRECEEELPDVFLLLAQIGPDAMMRMILRKPPHERTMEDLEIIYEELLHIKALSHLSTMVKRELASVLVFESHAKAGTVLFNQGDEGKSWYIILKGSVNVVIYGKGVVCTLHEGDDFGKLALVNDAPRAATIVLRDNDCHFLRVDKEDFNRILRDVEANTVRLKEHGQDVLVLEKIPSNTQSSDGVVQAHYKYSVMAGTPEKMLEHLLESRLDNRSEAEIDGFLEDFLLTHVIFMPYNHLCPVLISHYHSSTADTSEQEAFEFMLNHKKCVLHFIQEWANIVGAAFRQDHTINAFLEELRSCVLDDLHMYPSLKDDLVALETILSSHDETSEGKQKKKVSGNFTLSRKHSKDNYQDVLCKRRPIRASEENLFKVYCADHTYSTLKLPMATTVEQLLLNTKEKLGLGDDLVLCEVKSTGERIIFKENDLCVTTGLSINGQLFVTPKEHLDALTPLPEQEDPTEGTFSTIETVSSKEIAYYMSVYDWELFSCVQEYELIYQVFGRYKFGKITANLDLFLRRFNEIQYWVVTEMVLTINLSKRVSLLRKFIKLASYCKEHQNLNSFFAIVMGLSNIAVSRLSQTWEKLPGKFKKMFADFETLMDPSRNHRVYRLSVAKMAPPIVPFMPLLMKDMTFTHEGNKTYFDGLVNFEKMHMIAQTLKTVRFCRSQNLELETPSSQKSSDVSSYIRNLRVIDNQRHLTQLSHKLEPRKT